MQKRALVVDDEDSHREHIVQELKGMDLKVQGERWLDYESGQGRDLVRAFRPHYAVVDSKYQSDLDGVEVVRMLCEEVENIRIVICTVLSDVGVKSAWIRERYDLPGVVGVLGKNPLPSGREITALFRS